MGSSLASAAESHPRIVVDFTRKFTPYFELSRAASQWRGRALYNQFLRHPPFGRRLADHRPQLN